MNANEITELRRQIILQIHQKRHQIHSPQNHAIWQVEKALDANGIVDGELTQKLINEGYITNQTETWKTYLENATSTNSDEREKNALWAVAKLAIDKAKSTEYSRGFSDGVSSQPSGQGQTSGQNQTGPSSCSHSDYDDLKKERDQAQKDRDNYQQQLSQKEQSIVQQLNISLNLKLNKDEKDLSKAIIEIQKLIHFDPAPSDPPVNNQALQKQLQEAQQTITQLQNQLNQKQPTTPFGESIKEIIKVDEKLLNENQALKIELEKHSNYEQFAKERNKKVMQQIKEVNIEKIIQLLPQAKKEEVKENIEKSANYAELAQNRNQIITKYIQQDSNNSLQEIQQQQKTERTILISLLVTSLISVGGLLMKLKSSRLLGSSKGTKR